MRDMTRVNLKVTPDLEKIVSAAQEAKIAIQEINFVRNIDSDILEALAISIDGTEDSKGYFSWLLAKHNLSSELIA